MIGQNFKKFRFTRRFDGYRLLILLCLLQTEAMESIPHIDRRATFTLDEDRQFASQSHDRFVPSLAAFREMSQTTAKALLRFPRDAEHLQCGSSRFSD